METEERHRHALAALTAYATSKGEPIADAQVASEDIADLLTDLRHLANARGFAWPLIELRAKRHYGAEATPGAEDSGQRESTAR